MAFNLLPRWLGRLKTDSSTWNTTPPPPVSFPTYCRSRGGGGHLVNPKFFVVWVKSARGVCGMGHCFGNKLYCTRVPRWAESGESAMQDGVHLLCHPKLRLAT